MFAYKIKMANIHLSSLPTVNQILDNISEFTDTIGMTQYKIRRLICDISKAAAYGGSKGISQDIFSDSPQIFFNFIKEGEGCGSDTSIKFAFFWYDAFGENQHLIISPVKMPEYAQFEIKGK